MHSSQPPSFPRPSSSVARSRLQNRLVFSSTNNTKKAKQKSDRVHEEEKPPSEPAVLSTQESVYHESPAAEMAPIPTNDAVVSALSLEAEPSMIAESSLHMSLFLRNSTSVIPGADSLISSAIPNQVDDLSHSSHCNPSVINFSSASLTEAIEHIIRGDVEYLYLEASPSNPYELSLCSSTRHIDKSNFIILSRHGITRYREQDSDFVTFREFFREYTTYHKIITMPTFGTLRKWKPFLLWKKYVNSHKRKRTIEKLQANLFFLDSIYAPVVRTSFQTFRMLVDRETSRLTHHLLYDMNATPDTPSTAEACCKDAIVQEIIDRIATAGEQRALHVLSSMPTMEHAHRYMFNENSSYGTYGISTISHRRGASLQQPSEYSSLEGDQNLSFTQRASIRLHCRRTANLIRLFDFLFRDSLYEAVESSLKTFHAFLQSVQSNGSSTRQLATLTMIMPENSSLSLQPTRSELNTRLTQLLNETLSSGCHQNSLLLNQQFSDLLHPIINEITEFTLIDRVFQDNKNSLHLLVDQCLELILADVNACQAKVTEYAYLLDNHTRNMRRMKQVSCDYLHSLKPVEISKHLTEVEHELELYRSLPLFEICGVLRLEIRSVVRITYTQLLSYKALVCEKLPELFLALGENIYSETHRVATTLGKDSQDVDNFVKLVELYNIASSNSAKLEEAYVYVLALKEVMEEHAIPTTDEIFGLNATIRSEFVKCTDAISYFERNKEENTKIYKKELLVRVKLLQEPMEKIMLRISADLLLNPESNTDLVLEEIQNLFELLQGIVIQSNYVEKCQRALDMNAFDVVQATHTMKILSSMHALWLTIVNINDLISEIHVQPFVDVDIDKVACVVKEASRALQKADKRENSRLEDWIQRFIDNMNHLVPLLRCLTAPTILDRHKGQINSIVGMKLFQAEYTPPLQDIVDRCLVKHFDAIERIHYQSECESNLELLLRSLQSMCATKECVLLADSGNKGSMRIENIDDCVDMLEDVQVRVQSALCSKHIDCVRSEFNELLSNVNNWIRLCIHIRDLQRTNAEYKILFTSSRTARYVHTALRYFNITDDVWRMIVKTLKADCRLSALLERPKLEQMLGKALEAIGKVNETVNKFVEEQCATYPKFYLLNRTVLYDILETTDLSAMLTKTNGVLLPGITAFVMDSSDLQQIRGVISNAETLEFHSEISSRSNLGSWLKSVESAMTERLQADVHELVTDARQIVEDARNGYCCCQSRLLAYQVKFWTSLQSSLHPEKMASRSKLLRLQQLEVNDHITMLGTILSNAKTRQHIQSLSNLLLVASHCRDVLNKICEEVDFAHQSFHIVDAAIRKYYNTTSSSVHIEHYFMQASYGMQYLGLMQQIAITPLTEKVYVAMASALQIGIVPHLLGGKGSGKVYLLKQLLAEYGHELHVIHCDSSSCESLQNAVVAAVSAGLQMAFINAETLSTPRLSHLISLITAAQQAGLLYSSCTTVGSVQIAQHNISSTAAGLTLCMNMRHMSDIEPMPASLRQKFRPIFMHTPSYHNILSLVLPAFGYTDSYRSAVRLLAFLEHLHAQAEISMSLIMKLLLTKCIPIVAEEIIKQNMRDACVQLYTTVKYLFQALPRSLHQSIDMTNIQTACGLYMGVALNIDIDKFDFKPQNPDPVMSIVSALNTTSHVLVVGEVGVGKSTAIRSAIRSLNRKDRRSDEWPSKLFPRIINPTLLDYSTLNTAGLYRFYEEFTKANKYSYLHIDTPGQLFDYYYSNTLRYDRYFSGNICWECRDIRHSDPHVLSSLPIVYVDNAQYNIDSVLDVEIKAFCARCSDVQVVAKDLKKCVSLFIRPLLQVLEPSMYKSKDSLIFTTFQLLRALCATTSMPAPESYNAVSFQRIVFYACLWSLGTSSTSASYSVLTWFADFIERCTTPEKMIFPPSAQLFDYILQPTEDAAELQWMSWRESGVYARQVHILSQSPKEQKYYADYSLHVPTLLLPSKMSVAAAFLQQALSVTGGSLFISGELGSGKSSILRILLSDSASHRWSAALVDTSASRIVQHLHQAHAAQRTRILERGMRDRASIYVDDVNLSSAIESEDTPGMELYHSLLAQGGYYQPNTTQWKVYDQLYMLLAGSPRQRVASRRLLHYCAVLHLASSDVYLTHVLTAKFAATCPFVKEALSLDIVSISMRLFESLKMDDVGPDIVSVFVPRVSAAASVSVMLESIQVYVNNHAVVSSSDIVQAWKRVIASIAASPEYEKTLFNRLDTLALGVTFATPNFRALMTKGSVIKRDKMRLPTMLRRKSDVPVVAEAAAPEIKVKSIGLMDMLEVRNVVLSHASRDWDSVLDASNPKLWRDIQKIGLFFITPNKYAVIPDGMMNNCNHLVRLACDLCSASYRMLPPCYHDVIPQVVQCFLEELAISIYKAEPKSTEPKMWKKEYRMILRDLQLSPDVVCRTNVWHVHEPSDVNWSEIHAIFTMKHPIIYDSLFEIFGSQLYTNQAVHKALALFATSQKIIITLDSRSSQIPQLIDCPFVTPQLRCIYLTKTYGLNVDVLGLLFAESEAESLASRLNDIINALSTHDNISREVKAYIGTDEYKQGTYDMLIYILQLAEKSDTWFHYLSLLTRRDSCTEDGRMLVSDITYATLAARYLSCFTTDKQSIMDTWIRHQLETVSLYPRMSCADVALICYCVINGADAMLAPLTLARTCTGETSVALTALLLQLVCSNSVKIHGTSAFDLQFLLHEHRFSFSIVDGVVQCCRESAADTVCCKSTGVIVVRNSYDLIMLHLVQHGYLSDEHLLQSWQCVQDAVRQLCVEKTAPAADIDMYQEDVQAYVKEHFNKAHFICDTLSEFLRGVVDILPDLLSPCFSMIDSALSQYKETSLIRLLQLAMKTLYLYAKGFLSCIELYQIEVKLAVRCAVSNVDIFNHQEIIQDIRQILSNPGIHGLDVKSDSSSLMPSTSTALSQVTSVLIHYGLSTCNLKLCIEENISAFVVWMDDVVDIVWFPKVDLSWLEQIIVTALLKPVSLQAIVYYAIDNYGKWSISKLSNTLNVHIVPSSTHSDRAVLMLRNDMSVDASIVAMDSMKKGFFESVLLRLWPGDLDAVPSYIFPQHNTRRELTSTNTAPTFDRGFTLTRLDSGPVPRAVDILNFSSISRSNTTQEPPAMHLHHADTGLLHVIPRSDAPSLLLEVCNLLDDVIVESSRPIVPWQLWQQSTANVISDSVIVADNFASQLAHALRVLSHFLEMQDADCDMQLSRLLLLTAIYHAAVMCRLPQYHAIGDDTLLHALSFVAQQTCVKQTHERYLMHVPLYLYASPTANENFKCVVMALFEQYFTKEAMNFMEDYRVEPLDILVPDLLSIDALDACIRDVRSEVVHNCSVAAGMAYSEWSQRELNRFLAVLPYPIRTFQCSVASRSQRMRIVAEKFIALLPAPLDYAEKEAARLAKLSAKSTTSQIRQLSMQRNPGNINVRRVQRQSSGVFSRSYTEEDPIWRHCLLECQSFNTNLNILRQYLLGEDVSEYELLYLEQGEVPKPWVHADFEETLHGYISIDEYVAALKEKRQMLSHWLNAGHPGVLKLHLLHSSRGLLHALREASCRSLNVSLEEVEWTYSFIDMRSVSLNEMASMSGKGGECLIFSGLLLCNSVWNFDAGVLEAPTSLTRGCVSQEVCLKVSPVVEKDHNEDDFICPLYVSRDLQLIAPLMHGKTYFQAAPFLHVTLPCSDAEECALRNVSLRASGSWRHAKTE